MQDHHQRVADDAPRFSWCRVAGLAVALLVQLPFGLLLGPARPWRLEPTRQAAPDKRALQLSLMHKGTPSISMVAAGPPPSVRGRPQWRPPARHQDARRHLIAGASKRSVIPVQVAPPKSMPADAMVLPPTLIDSPPARPITTPRGYIAGGGRLGGDTTEYRHDADRLPGRAQIAHAPYFAMVAVEQQGVGRRVINLIGSLTHATDPHCLDVAVWSGMSPQEQLAHYTSPARIAEYTQRYHCVPPPRY